MGSHEQCRRLVVSQHVAQAFHHLANVAIHCGHRKPVFNVSTLPVPVLCTLSRLCNQDRIGRLDPTLSSSCTGAAASDQQTTTTVVFSSRLWARFIVFFSSLWLGRVGARDESRMSRQQGRSEISAYVDIDDSRCKRCACWEPVQNGTIVYHSSAAHGRLFP